MKVGRRRYRKGKGDEIPRLYQAKEWRIGKTHSREDEKGNDSNKDDMECRREVI